MSKTLKEKYDKVRLIEYHRKRKRIPVSVVAKILGMTQVRYRNMIEVVVNIIASKEIQYNQFEYIPNVNELNKINKCYRDILDLDVKLDRRTKTKKKIPPKIKKRRKATKSSLDSTRVGMLIKKQGYKTLKQFIKDNELNTVYSYKKVYTYIREERYLNKKYRDADTLFIDLALALDVKPGFILK